MWLCVSSVRPMVMKLKIHREDIREDDVKD